MEFKNNKFEKENIVTLLPEMDIDTHEQFNINCHCRPLVEVKEILNEEEELENRLFIYHQSFDRREILEDLKIYSSKKIWRSFIGEKEVFF